MKLLERHPLLISMLFGVLVAVGIWMLKRVSLIGGVMILGLSVLALAWRFVVAARAGRARRGLD